jgi:hypothetical protein
MVSLIIYQIPYITANDISTGFFFTTDSFRGLAMQAFLDKFSSQKIPQFARSDGCIADLKRRNGFSSRVAH